MVLCGRDDGRDDGREGPSRSEPDAIHCSELYIMVAATTATAICSLSRTCIIILCLYHVHFVLINDILI